MALVGGVAVGLSGITTALNMSPDHRHNVPEAYLQYVLMAYVGFGCAVTGSILVLVEATANRRSRRRVNAGATLAFHSLGRTERLVLGLGFVLIGGYVLFWGLALADSQGISDPWTWMTGFAGFALSAIGVWLTIMGATQR